MDEIIGAIKLFAGNYAPYGYLYCKGQLLSINAYSVLFTILKTTYGGDGITTFALPDLRSRVPVGGSMGASPSVGTTVNSGEMAGETRQTLKIHEKPAHSHGIAVSNANASQAAATPTTTIATPGAVGGGVFNQTLGFNTALPNTTLNEGTVISSGSSSPHNNMQPYLGLSYIIYTGTAPDQLNP
jgi:microcystin-dependent protein